MEIGGVERVCANYLENATRSNWNSSSRTPLLIKENATRLQTEERFLRSGPADNAGPPVGMTLRIPHFEFRVLSFGFRVS
jgi:hypothetical protein